MKRVEKDFAVWEMSIRGWASYSDLTVLGSGLQARQLVCLLANCAVKVNAVCLTTCCRFPDATRHHRRPGTHSSHAHGGV